MSGNSAGEARELAKPGQIETSRAVTAVVKSIVGEAVKVVEVGGADGVRPGEVEGLSVNQQRALESIVQGVSLMETSKRVGVARSTLYEWLKKDVVFRAAYNKWHNMMDESCRTRLKMMAGKAMHAVEKALEGGDAKLALALLNGMGLIKRSRVRATDAEVLKRRDEARRILGEAKLRDRENYARYVTKPTTPFSELR